MDSFYTHLNIDYSDVEKILGNKNFYYQSFPIKKSSGKLRWIDAPKKILKDIQLKILHGFLYKAAPHPAAVGFMKNKSVSYGAAKHLGNKSLLNVDLKDYFHSITISHVCSTLLPLLTQRVVPVDNINNVLQELGALLTYRGRLPQGAPTSPAISNLKSYPLDNSITEYFTGKDITYTRYADDLSFSHPSPSYNFSVHLKDILRIVVKNDFLLNFTKTRILRPHKRMCVTGVVINEKLGVPKYVWRNLRAKLHNYERDNVKISTEEYQQIRGQIAWIMSLTPGKGERLLEALSKIL